MTAGAYPVAPRKTEGACVVEAAITEGHRKLALVHLGEEGASWCLASDEGASCSGGPLAGPIDTHLFLNGSAPEAEMQALLAMGAGTCYLHATLGAALAPLVGGAAG